MSGSIRKLVSRVCLQEGRRHQAMVGDCREIVAIISEELAKDSQLVSDLIKNGIRRLKKKSLK